MKTPKPPSLDAPGDPEAVQNASRRAERRGTANPTRIDTQVIRAALSKAKNKAELVQLLKDQGIEAVFEKRGHEQKIYGWKLRTIGAAEWLKGSTIAKDLSWPNIAHHFVSDIQDEVDSENVSSITTTRQAKIPAMLIPLMKKSQIHSEKISRSAEHQIESASLVQALTLLGDVLSKCTFALANLVLSFLIKALIFLFGIDTKFAPEETQIFHAEERKFGLRLEPIMPVISDNQNAAKLEAKATVWTDKITQALIAKNTALLPDGAGTELIVEQMKFEGSPLETLKVAAASFNSAAMLHHRAGQKVDERPVDRSHEFESHLSSANEKLGSLTGAMRTWQGSTMLNSVLALLNRGKQKEFDDQIAEAKAEVDFRAEDFKEYQLELDSAQKKHDLKPWPRPAAHIVKARDETQIALRGVNGRVLNILKFKLASVGGAEKIRLEKMIVSAVKSIENFAREANTQFLLKGLAEFEAAEKAIAFELEKLRAESEQLAWEAKHNDSHVKPTSSDDLPEQA